ncbi:MAG: hypothetical protein LBH37_03800 [Oscillospiraceae bacterium]|jgi:hypothetical protein|nr:hypothetical protein [Oscillospiraceae bacterium]
MIFEHIKNVGVYNCFLAVIATLAKYYGRDYHMISSSDWKLKYDVAESNKRVGERIDIINQIDASDRAGQFHGFTWEVEILEDGRFNNQEHFEEFTYPSIGSFDLYYLKGSTAYQKYHFSHYIIISEYDFKTETYICIDPYFQYAKYNIPREDLYSGINKYAKLIFLELPKKNSMENYIKVIQEDIITVNQDNENDTNIRQLASDICTKMDINYEFDEFKNDLQTVPILDKIRKVAMYRDAYICMLDYIYKLFKLKYLKEASNLLRQSVTLWKTAKGKLLKTYITNSINNDRGTISKMITQIADIERQAINIVLSNKIGGV